MKKLLLIVSFLIFQISNAQIISIPDANFKTFLTYTPGSGGYGYATNLAGSPIRVDSNFDNQISVQEAANVASLEIFDNAPVSSLSGLEFFTNLKYFSISSSTLTSFNFPTLVNLEFLSVNVYFYYSIGTLLTSSLNVLNINGNINLKSLYAVTGNVTNLNLSNSNLETLYLINNNISNLDLSASSGLKTLYLETGNMANLLVSPNNINLKDISLTVQNSNFNIPNGYQYLRNLSCNFQGTNNINLGLFPALLTLNYSGPNITTVNTSTNLMLSSIGIANANLTVADFNANTNLEYLSIINSNLQSINIANLQFIKNINLQGNKLTSLNFNNLINLNSFNISNNLLTQFSINNNFLEVGGFDFSGNPTLQTICCDANETAYVQNQCNFLSYFNVVVDSNCGATTVLANENFDFSENKISLYPNPTSNILNIESQAVINSISISDINGRFVATNLFDINKIDVQNLQSGIYFLQIASDSQIKTLKFVKE